MANTGWSRFSDSVAALRGGWIFWFGLGVLVAWNEGAERSLVMVLLLSGMLLIAGHSVFVRFRNRWLIDTHESVVATGRIVDLKPLDTGWTTPFSPTAIYEYRVERDGRAEIFRGAQAVVDELVDEYSLPMLIGREIQVRYRPDRPAISRLEVGVG